MLDGWSLLLNLLWNLLHSMEKMKTAQPGILSADR